MAKAYYLGLDIGGTFMRIGALDEKLNMLKCAAIKSDILRDNENPLETLKNMIADFMDALSGQGELCGIGMGIPGTVEKSKESASSVPNIHTLEKLPIARYIKDTFGVPAVLENDVALLLLHDINAWGLQGGECILGFYIGTGLGNAMYICGQIWEGCNGAAAELGHIPVLGSESPCGCGNRGCIELFTSGKRLQEIHQTHFPDTVYEELFEKHASHPAILEFIDNIAAAVATELNILDPQCIIVGGGVANMKSFPSGILRDCIKKRMRIPGTHLKILYAGDDKWAGVKGAVIRLLEKMQ